MLSIKEQIFLLWKALIIGAVTCGVSNICLHSFNENSQVDKNEFLCLISNIISKKERQILNKFLKATLLR
jgi:hypothetical protein